MRPKINALLSFADTYTSIDSLGTLKISHPRFDIKHNWFLSKPALLRFISYYTKSVAMIARTYITHPVLYKKAAFARLRMCSGKQPYR